MRKLLLILLAFIAVFNLIRTIDGPYAAELGENRQEEKAEITINN